MTKPEISKRARVLIDELIEQTRDTYVGFEATARHAARERQRVVKQHLADYIAELEAPRIERAGWKCGYCDAPYLGPTTPAQTCNQPSRVTRGAVCGCELVPR